MDGGSPRFVEFLDDDGVTPELADEMPRRGPARLLLVGAALLVLLAGAGWARSSNDVPAVRKVAAPPAPPVRAVVDRVTSAGSPYGLVGPCPAGAQCFGSAPAAAAAALQAAFPGAVLVSAASILANRAGHSDPGLLRRVMLAERGDQLIQVRIQAGPPPPTGYVRRPYSPGGIARVVAEREGYAVSVVIIGPRAVGATTPATRLAEDLRLLAST